MAINWVGSMVHKTGDLFAPSEYMRFAYYYYPSVAGTMRYIYSTPNAVINFYKHRCIPSIYQLSDVSLKKKKKNQLSDGI